MSPQIFFCNTEKNLIRCDVSTLVTLLYRALNESQDRI